LQKSPECSNVSYYQLLIYIEASVFQRFTVQTIDSQSNSTA